MNSALVIVDRLDIVLVVVLVVKHVLLALMVEVLLEVLRLVGVVAATVVSILTVRHVMAVLSRLAIVFIGISEDSPVCFLLFMCDWRSSLHDIVMLGDHWFRFVVHWCHWLHVRHVVVRGTRRRHCPVLEGRLVMWHGHLGV